MLVEEPRIGGGSRHAADDEADPDRPRTDEGDCFHLKLGLRALIGERPGQVAAPGTRLWDVPGDMRRDRRDLFAKTGLRVAGFVVADVLRHTMARAPRPRSSTETPT